QLATCFEQTRRLARAWTLFREVATWANEQGQPAREEVALARARALEPRLSKLVMMVPWASQLDGAEVTVDGAVVAPGQYGVPVPVDLGVHVVVGRASKRTPS